jgi:beta-glucuronidase
MRKTTFILFLIFLFVGFFYYKLFFLHEAPSPSPSSQYTINPQLIKILQGLPVPEPAFQIQNTGTNKPVNYERYGKFQNLKTNHYHYSITDLEGLQKALGAGIYPNEKAIRSDPKYKAHEEFGLLDEFHWDSLTFDDWQKAFYIWTQAPEAKGIKTFFTGYCLEKAGHIRQALKAYHATLIHFPRTACWSKDQTFVWYVGRAALDNIRRLCREYPDLELSLENAYFQVINGKDTDLKNDIIRVHPGHFVKKTLEEKISQLPRFDDLDVVDQRGKGEVKLLQFSNGHWLMTVDDQPFYVQGMTYRPTQVGLGPRSDPHFAVRWMFSDSDQNQKIDAPFDAWVDANKNAIQDETEPSIGDFQLMKDMGVNAIRLYVENDPVTEYDPTLLNKQLLRKMHRDFGIKVIVGDFLGAYTIGSGASWNTGTDYTDVEQKRNMKKAVRAKVLDLKDEPFVLMWLLGNENNLPLDYTGHNTTRTNAAQHPQAYAEFLNDVAKMIHDLDGDHPVAVGNIETGLLEYYQKYAPEIDILGINSYRGTPGFGDLWKSAQEKFDRPVLITEFGCDAYAQAIGEDQEAQLAYHKAKWRDILLQQAGGPLSGVSLGGVIFEYLDEWWKDAFGHPENLQQTNPQAASGFPDGFTHEEWFGIVGQGNGSHSPFQRELRKTYYYYKDLQ